MKWHPYIAAVVPSVSACASVCLQGAQDHRTFRGFLKERYPGYDQILPAATALANEPSFDYLPGNVMALALQKRSTLLQSALWNNIGIFSPEAASLLSAFKPVAGKIDQRGLRLLDRSLRKATRACRS